MIFTTVVFIAIAIYMKTTEKERLWKSKNFQDTRKMFITAGREDPSVITKEMRSKYGYEYDPWCEKYDTVITSCENKETERNND